MPVLLAVLAMVAQTGLPSQSTPAATSPAASPLHVDTLRPAGGPEVLWNRYETPLVAIRLIVPLPAALPLGRAELLQELVRATATASARAVGAEVALEVEGGAATIAITGHGSAFDALAGILRDAVREPDLSAGSLRAARVRAEDRVLAALERPEPRLRALLRARLDGREAAGPDLETMGPEDVRALAGRLYRHDRLRVVLVGDVPPEVVRSAFGNWPSPSAGVQGAGAASGPPLPAPQAHNAWAGVAWPLEASHAVSAVAAELVSRRMREQVLVEGAAEAWVTSVGGVLVVLGGAPRGDPEIAGAARVTAFPTAGNEDGDASGLARYLRRKVAEAAAVAGPAGVADAAVAIRRRMLLEARTPEGRARLIARWTADRSLGAPTVHSVLEELGTLDPVLVRAALDDALAAAPLLAEIRP